MLVSTAFMQLVSRVVASAGADGMLVDQLYERLKRGSGTNSGFVNRFRSDKPIHDA